MFNSICQSLIKSFVTLSLLYILPNNVCQGVMCDQPPSVINADADVRGLKGPFLNGTIISYVCHNGYTLTSNVSAVAICVVNNASSSHHWHLEPFSCESTCDTPTIKYATIDLNNRQPPFSSGESIRYTCELGYSTESGRSYGDITCGLVNGSVSWILPSEACRPRSCGYPGDIENAVRRGSLYTFPNGVTYICNEGFQVRGVSTIFCSATGNWRPNIPSCEAVVCPLLSHLENGTVISPERKYGAEALYKCNPKFRLKGDSRRICQADAGWSGNAPTCIEITCPYPGPIPNGRVIPLKDRYPVGDVAIFICKDDSHKYTSKCTDNGDWTTMPPHCKGVPSTASPNQNSTEIGIDGSVLKENCEDPGEIKNGKREFVRQGSDASTTHVNLTYSCEDGYELRGQGTLICSSNGKWNIEKLPICVKPIPVSTIIAIVISIIIVVLLGIGGFLYYQWRGRKLQGFGKKSKALTTDATDLEEIAKLEKGKKPIPVTVL